MSDYECYNCACACGRRCVNGVNKAARRVNEESYDREVSKRGAPLRGCAVILTDLLTTEGAEDEYRDNRYKMRLYSKYAVR